MSGSTGSFSFYIIVLTGMRFSLLICGILLLCPQVAAAQTVPTDFERSRFSPAAYYNYAEAGDITIRVNVWGTVQNPGLYEIPQGTHLSTLLSVAGGPAAGPRNEREDRTISVRLFRQAGGERGLIFQDVMQNEIFVSQEDPVLQEGDVLAVETTVRQRFNWRDVLPIISASASVGLAIAYFTR